MVRLLNKVLEDVMLKSSVKSYHKSINYGNNTRTCRIPSVLTSKVNIISELQEPKVLVKLVAKIN